MKLYRGTNAADFTHMIAVTRQKYVPTCSARVVSAVSPGVVFGCTMKSRVLIGLTKSSGIKRPDYERVIMCVGVSPDGSLGEITA